MRHSQQGLDGGFLRFLGNWAAFLALVLSLLFMLVTSVGLVQAFAASTQCTRTYDGDLVLTGHQVLEITGETVCVHGNILVKDNAKLVLKDVTLRMDKFTPSFWDNWAQFDVFNSATVEINNVVFALPGGAIWLASHDQAVVHLDNVTSSGDSSGIHLQAYGNSQMKVASSSLFEADIFESADMTIQDSQLAWAVRMGLDGKNKIVLSDVAPGKFDNWEFPTAQSVPFHISLQNTSVGAWSIFVGEGADVRIVNSKLDELLLNLGQAKGSLHGLVPGHFVSWSLHRDNQIDCATKVELKDTTTNRWSLDLSGRAEITLNDSTIADLRFTDAYVDLSLKNVKASLLEANDALGKIDFDGSSITQGIEFDNATLTLTGNVSISPDCFISKWQNSTIIRDFPILVEKDFDTPASQVPIEITLPDGRKLDQTTDDNGKTPFQCTFTDATYQDTCQLQVTAGKKEIKHSFGFLESTPVTISLLRADTSSDSLFVATAGALLSIDPYNIQLRDNGSIFPNVYEPLFLRNLMSPAPAVPLLATEVPSLDNGLVALNEDGSCSIKLPIRSGVLFHDGTPLTPADVEYSLELGLLHDLKDALGPTLSEALLDVDSCDDLVKQVGLEETCRRVQAAVEANGTEVVIHLKRPFSPWLDSLSKIPIVSKAWTISHGGWNGMPGDWTRYHDLPQEKSPFHLAANGTGPFVVDKFTPGEQLLLKRNNDYWRDPAKLKWVVINEIKDWTQLRQDFQSGELDMIDYRGERPEFAEQISLLRSVPNVNVIDCTPSLGMGFITFNWLVTEDSNEQLLPRGKLDESSIPVDFFSDPDVRRGFIYAFDFPAFAKSALLGHAQHRDGPVWGDCPEPEVNYNYDPAKASKYFRKAFSGRLWKTGFTVTITYNQGNQVRRIAAEIMKKSLEVINPKFHIVISAILFKDFAQKLLYEDSLPLFIIGLTPADGRSLQPAYIFMYSNGLFGEKEIPICDELIEKAYRTMNMKQRDSLLCQIAHIGEENSMGIFWQQSVLHVQQEWIQGWAYGGYLNNGNTVYFYPIWKKLKED